MFRLFAPRLLSRFSYVHLALAVMGLALLPFVVLAAYCHPSADDFWLTNMVLAKGPWQAQLEIRQTWSGRYTSMFLGSFNPLVYRSLSGYQLLPVVLLVFLAVVLYLLFKEITGSQVSRKIPLVLALLFLVVYLHQMPTVAQTIYWMSGALTYQAANILLLFLLAAFVRYFKEQEIRRTFWQKIKITLILFAIIGCNETSMCMLAFLICCFVLVATFRNRRLNYFLLWLLVVTFVSIGIVIWAPGNAVRAQDYPLDPDLGYALWHALLVPINNSLNWLLHSPVLLISALFIPVAAKWLPIPVFLAKTHPVTAFFIWYGCLASGYFVAYWSKHGSSPPRAQDSIYFFFLLGLIVNVLILGQYLGRQKYQLPPLPNYVTWILLLWGTCFVFFSKQSNIRIAYADLLSGQAVHYNQEMHMRYASLQNSTCQVCPIKAAGHRPKTIFFEEVTADTTWENTFYARYFGKKLLLVSE